MKNQEFIMLVGLPGSGKSTYAEKLIEERKRAHIVSTDTMRESLHIDRYDNISNEIVIRACVDLIKKHLENGDSVVYDATNLFSKRRRAILEELAKFDCKKRCVIIATELEQCKKSNSARISPVPDESIDSMYLCFKTPYWFEGWDYIDTYYRDYDMKNPEEWVDSVIDFNQNNIHHQLSLGEHCRMVADKFEEGSLLYYTGLLHDTGKPLTMKVSNDSEYSCFYSHENAGAYETLFYDCGSNDPLDVSILVNLHMMLHFLEEDSRALDKYRRLWGDCLYSNLVRLHDADVDAH